MSVKKHLLTTFVASSICLGFLSPASAGVAQWSKYTIDGAAAYKEFRYGDAERAFKKAIAEAKKFGSDDIRLAASLANLGVLYNFRGFFDKAEPLFEKAVTIQEKCLKPTDNELISSYGKLCQFYLRRKKFDKANPLSVRVIAYGDKRIEELKSFKKKPRPQEQKAKEKYDKELNQYLELAVLFDKMARAYEGYKVNGRMPKSEKLYKLSLKLRENVLHGNHLALATGYENLGKLYLKERRYKLAEPLLKRAYKMSRHTLGFAKPETYRKLHSWNQALAGVGKAWHAEKNYKYALQEFSEAYGNRSGHVANIDIALANLLAGRGRYSQASVYMRRALKIQERLRGPNHAITHSLRNDYLSMLRKAHRYKEASRLQANASDDFNG